MRVREYRVTWSDGGITYPLATVSAKRAVESARFYRGWRAPVANVAVLVKCAGPGLGIAGAGYFSWVTLQNFTAE